MDTPFRDGSYAKNSADVSYGTDTVSGQDPSMLHAEEEVETVERKFQIPHVPWVIVMVLILTTLAQYVSSSTVSLFVLMDLEFSPVELTRYYMFLGYTLWTQPLIGWMCDKLVVFGERRRPFMIVCIIINMVLFGLYSAIPVMSSSYSRFVAISMLQSLASMGVYIPLNGLIIELGRDEAESYEDTTARMGTLMSQTMVWRTTGSLVGSLLQTVLLVRLKIWQMLGVTAVIYFLLIPVVAFVPRSLFLRKLPENPEGGMWHRCQKTYARLRKSLNVRDARSDGMCFIIVLLFVFLYTAMPDGSMVYYSFLYNEFRFPAWFFSLNGAIGMLGSLGGAALYAWLMARSAKREALGLGRISIFSVFVLGSISWSFGYVTNLMLATGFITESLSIPATWFVPIDNFATSGFVRFAFMPTLTMAAEHAPRDYEATAFELFSIAASGGGMFSALVTSFIAEGLGITSSNFDNLWLLLALAATCRMIPIIIAASLPERRITADVVEEGNASPPDATAAKQPSTLSTEPTEAKDLLYGDALAKSRSINR